MYGIGTFLSKMLGQISRELEQLYCFLDLHIRQRSSFAKRVGIPQRIFSKSIFQIFFGMLEVVEILLEIHCIFDDFIKGNLSKPIVILLKKLTF